MDMQVARGQKLQWQQGQKDRLQLRSKVAIAATKDEKAVEQMKRDIEKGDVWDNEVVGLGLQVGQVPRIAAPRPHTLLDRMLPPGPNPQPTQSQDLGAAAWHAALQSHLQTLLDMCMCPCPVSFNMTSISLHSRHALCMCTALSAHLQR